MKTYTKFALLVLTASLVMLVSVSAFAQSSSGSVPTATTVLTPILAVTMVINALIGALGQAVQSGSVFGIVTTPKAWVPYLTVALTFFTGAGAYLSTASSLTLTVALYALFAGFMGLIGKTTGAGVVMHFNAARVQRTPPANDNADKAKQAA